MVKSCGWWVVANEIILLSLALFAFPFLTPISHSHFPFSFPILIPILIPISRSDFPFPSSEEMMAAMTEVNELQDTKNLVILSTDISAMFTSMDIAECAKIAADMFFESGMELNIDTEELFKLLDLDQVARGSSRHQHQEDPGQRHQDQVNLTRTRPVSSSESRSRFSSKLRCRSTCTALKET